MDGCQRWRVRALHRSRLHPQRRCLAPEQPQTTKTGAGRGALVGHQSGKIQELWRPTGATPAQPANCSDAAQLERRQPPQKDDSQSRGAASSVLRTDVVPAHGKATNLAALPSVQCIMQPSADIIRSVELEADCPGDAATVSAAKGSAKWSVLTPATTALG